MLLNRIPSFGSIVSVEVLDSSPVGSSSPVLARGLDRCKLLNRSPFFLSPVMLARWVNDSDKKYGFCSSSQVSLPWSLAAANDTMSSTSSRELAEKLRFVSFRPDPLSASMTFVSS